MTPAPCLLLLLFLGGAPAEASAQDTASPPAQPRSCSTAALSTSLLDAESAFNAMDGPLFSLSRDEARRLLGCLSEPLSPALAAAYHRMEGFDADLSGDGPRARLAFRAALALDPGHLYDPNMAYVDGPLDQFLRSARVTVESTPRDLPACPGLRYLIDGNQALRRPGDRAAIVQIVERDGELRSSLWLGPEDRLDGDMLCPPPPPPPLLVTVQPAVDWFLLRGGPGYGLFAYDFNGPGEISVSGTKGWPPPAPGEYHLFAERLRAREPSSVFGAEAQRWGLRYGMWIPPFPYLGMDLRFLHASPSVGRIGNTLFSENWLSLNHGSLALDARLRPWIGPVSFTLGFQAGVSTWTCPLVYIETLDLRDKESKKGEKGTGLQTNALSTRWIYGPWLAPHLGLETASGFHFDVVGSYLFVKSASVEIGQRLSGPLFLSLSGDWLLHEYDYHSSTGSLECTIVDQQLTASLNLGLVFKVKAVTKEVPALPAPGESP